MMLRIQVLLLTFFFLGTSFLEAKDSDESFIYISESDSNLSLEKKSNKEICLYSKEDTLLFTRLEKNDSLIVSQKGDTAVFYFLPLIDVYRLRIDGQLVKFQKQNPYRNSLSLRNIFKGIFALIVLVFIAFLFSDNKKAINWKTVGIGVGLQLLFGILVLRSEFVKNIFQNIAEFFVVVLDFTKSGSQLLFGDLLNVNTIGYIFAFQVLPTIVFFSALTSLLYHLNILQKVVYGIAWVMQKTMKISGAESLSAAANIFVGQTEAPLVVKPYIPTMTKSEIMCLMTGGMATIAGAVLAAYVGFLGSNDPEQERIVATQLLAASIMSAPAALVMAKIFVPETQEIDESVRINQEKNADNALEAISNGTSEGLKLAVNVGAMLLVFTAFMALFNYVLKEWIGGWTGLNEAIYLGTEGRYDGLSLQLILGYIFSPIALLIGVEPQDMVLAGQLLGEKTILNEFFAFTSLGNLMKDGSIQNPKSIVVITYALAGFSNIASIGIQIGGIGTLAPKRKGLLSRLGFKAMIAATIACLMTASIAGMLY